MAIANRNVVARALAHPDREVMGYGALSYTPNGYGSGALPPRLASLFRSGGRPTIYSYSTPIAWFDREHGVWVIPDVKYSITTSKHQSYLSRLTGRCSYDRATQSLTHTPSGQTVVHIPRDCGVEEYGRYVSQQMVYTGKGTKPGPNYTPEA